MSIATKEQTVVDAVSKQLYIGGEWRDGTGGGTLEVEDPATGEALCEVADATPADAVQALDAAVDAQADWANVPPIERGEILRRAFEKLIEREEDLALLMTLEMGKPIAESRSEIAYAAEFFRWFAGEATRVHGDYYLGGNGKGRVLTMKQPIGPSLMITPWNFPMAMGTRKIGPAIAAGCTIVMKPASQTPLSMLALAQILEESGLPGGVLNVITSSSSGSVMEPLIRDPRARKLSFTGSTEVGRKLLEQASEQILKVSMELGGNAPFLVFEDADLDAAVDGALLAKMRNIGEACTSANRFHVAAPVAEEFAERLAAKMGPAEDRPRHRGGREGRPADQPGRDRQDRGAGGRRALKGREGDRRRQRGRRARLLLRAHGAHGRAGGCPRAGGGDLRPGGADHHLRHPTRRRSTRRTTRSSASSPTSSRATSSARSA